MRIFLQLQDASIVALSWLRGGGHIVWMRVRELERLVETWTRVEQYMREFLSITTRSAEIPACEDAQPQAGWPGLSGMQPTQRPGVWMYRRAFVSPISDEKYAPRESSPARL